MIVSFLVFFLFLLTCIRDGCCFIEILLAILCVHDNGVAIIFWSFRERVLEDSFELGQGMGMPHMRRHRGIRLTLFRAILTKDDGHSFLKELTLLVS